MDAPIGCSGDGAPAVIAATRRWLEKAVIGLGLCPFAAGVYRGGRVRFRVSARHTAPELLSDLCDELQWLQTADPEQCDTTLLIHPWVLGRFEDYNDFLEECDTTLHRLGLAGELQIASFHPDYRFAGSAPQDTENFTNRSPFPMLHLLREASVERGVATVEDPDDIYRRNIETLRALGRDGWDRMWVTDG